jgi:hypothetical protein
MQPNQTSRIAMLQALGQLGEVERERFTKVISLLAINSPEAITGIDGAKAGMFAFKGETPPYRASFIGLPIFEHVMFVEWPPERSKGAPLANHVARPSQAQPDEDGDWRMLNGNRIVKTRYLYIAVADSKGQIDFGNIRALALTSSGLGFFDSEFASQYPMTISIDGKETQGPMACCKWKFASELSKPNARSQTWMKVKYIKGSLFGSPNGPTWDEMFRGAELEAEMQAADRLARQQAGIIDAKPTPPAPQIEAKAPPAVSVAQAGAAKAVEARAKMTVTTGKMTPYDPGPPAPPPAPEETGEGPGEKAPIELNDEVPF